MESAKLNLATLDAAIVGQIMDHLLDANRVKCAGQPPRTSNVRYAFEPAVLRTCKRLHLIGSHTFTRNHFILVKTTSTTLKSIIHNNGVRMWKNDKIIRFKRHHMTVKVVLKKYDPLQGSKQLKNFLVCLEGIEGFIMALRLVDLVYQPGHSFNFQMRPAFDGTTLTPKIQSMLLEPFHKLQLGPDTTCVVEGDIDRELADTTQTLMQPRIFWSRARPWEFIEAVMYKKKAADRVLADGNMLDAHGHHHNLLNFIDVMWPVRKQLLLGDDPALRSLWFLLDMSVTMNAAMVEIHSHWQDGNVDMVRQEFETVLHRGGHVDDVNALPPPSAALVHFLCGIGAFVFGSFAAAVHSCEEAARLMPTISRYRNVVALARKWSSLSIMAQAIAHDSGAYSHDLAALMTMLPKEPVLLPEMVTKSAIACLDQEKCILSGLGYNGNLLEDRIEQKQGWSYHWNGEIPGPADLELGDLLLACNKLALEIENPGSLRK